MMLPYSQEVGRMSISESVSEAKPRFCITIEGEGQEPIAV